MVQSQKAKQSQRRKAQRALTEWGFAGITVGRLFWRWGLVCGDIGSHLKAEWVVVQLGVMKMNDHF